MRRLAPACAAILAILASAATAQETPRVFVGGTVHTGVEYAPFAEAVAVSDGRVLLAGTRAEAMEAAGADAELVELDGAHLFPGLTDSHVHLQGIGARAQTLNLDDVRSVAELKERVAEAAQTTEGVIEGRGWIETGWPEGRMPTAADLEEAAPGRAILLTRADGHALVASPAALEAAGIDRMTRDPDGGMIERDADGEAVGLLIDNAMALVSELREQPSEETVRDRLRLGAELMAELGWTGVHNMSVSLEEARIIDDLAEAGELPIRVYNALDYDDGYLFDEGPWEAADGRAITRAYKLYADGALGSRGAALLAPYEDAVETVGLTLITGEEIAPILERALREGIQICVHAIGDRANRLVLDWFEAAFEAVPPEERAIAIPRWRIEHSQIIDPADIPRFGEMGVIASMQPSHAIGDLHFAPPRLGIDRLEGAYAWQSLLDTDAIVAAGSDAPVEKGDPRIEFYAAVARKDLEGFSGEGWHPEQAVSREDALRMFTTWPAYASFREDELGVIAPGMRADFSVFAEDLMTISEDDILTATPVMTVLDGETAWAADSAAPSGD